MPTMVRSMERRTYPRDVKLTVKSFSTVVATWADRNAQYEAEICFFGMRWYLAQDFRRTLRVGSGRPHTLSINADANWAIKAGLEALVVPAKLDELQRAFVQNFADKREADWLLKQQEDAVTDAAHDMLDSLRKTQAYLDRRNDALTLDELKINVSATLEKATFRRAPR